MYSKIIIFTLFICINAFADFYDQIEKIDKKREDIYFDMNKTLKKPDTSIYKEQIQNAMNGFLRPAIAELLRQNLGDFHSNGQEPLYTSATQCTFHILEKE